jgi:serine/threonine protein kinase
MIMDIADGNLQDMIKNLHEQYTKMCGVSYLNEYIPPYDRRMIWKELVAIVATLQRNNISHMDLKPANIVRFGNMLKVCDLGVSEYGSG